MASSTHWSGPTALVFGVIVVASCATGTDSATFGVEDDEGGGGDGGAQGQGGSGNSSDNAGVGGDPSSNNSSSNQSNSASNASVSNASSDAASGSFSAGSFSGSSGASVGSGGGLCSKDSECGTGECCCTVQMLNACIDQTFCTLGGGQCNP